MTSDQEAKLNMYNAVINYSDASTAITATIAAYGTTLTKVKTKRDAIVSAAQLESEIISGITVNKADLKKALCESATSVAAGLFAYAASINDETLKAKGDFSYSDFFKKRDDELPVAVQNIHDEANAVVASLAPFGILPATLTALQTAITTYGDQVSAPRNAVAQRKTYTAQLKTLFKEADEIIKEELDKVALQFKATQPVFYSTYKNNRIIIDPGTSQTKAEGLIKNQYTNAAVSGVIVTVQGESYTATSDLNGSFKLVIPVPGTYTVLCKKEGYTDFEIPNVVITLGQTTNLGDIIMVSLSRIIGSITNANTGAPVGGVDMKELSFPETIIHPDAQGKYEYIIPLEKFGPNPSGGFVFQVTKEGYEPFQNEEAIEVNKGQTVTYNIQLIPTP